MRKLFHRVVKNIFLISFVVAALPSYAELKLNGIAHYTELGKAQFVAGLYTEALTDNKATLLSGTGNKRMEMRIQNDHFSSRRFKRLWLEGIAVNASPEELKAHTQNLATLNHLLKVPLKQGDIFTITLSQQSQVAFHLNAVKLGKVKHPEFFNLLLRTWIGTVPLSTPFRDALLKQGNIDPGMLANYHRITPTQERQTAMAALAAKLKRREPPKLAGFSIAAPSLPSPEETKRQAQQDKARKARQDYVKVLNDWTDQHVVYSKSAARHKKEDTVKMKVTIKRNGEVTNINISKKSQYGRLNNAAIKSIELASPYPKVPNDIDDDSFTFTTPVVFSLKGKP